MAFDTVFILFFLRCSSEGLGHVISILFLFNTIKAFLKQKSYFSVSIV